MSSSLKSVLEKSNPEENQNTVNPTPNGRYSLGAFFVTQIWATLFPKKDLYENQGEARFPEGQKNVDGYCVLSEESPPPPPRNNTGKTTPIR